MGVQNEVNRIRTNIAKALTAISEKGVIIPDDANSDDLESLIKKIIVIGAFTVNGTSFKYEMGMTWEEFVSSDYNYDGQTFYIDNDGFILYTSQLYDKDGVAVYKDDLIIADMAYET